MNRVIAATLLCVAGGFLAPAAGAAADSTPADFARGGPLPPLPTPPPPAPAPVTPPASIAVPAAPPARPQQVPVGLALTGAAGLVGLTGTGSLIGYRQAKAGFALRAAGTARFLP